MSTLARERGHTSSSFTQGNTIRMVRFSLRLTYPSEVSMKFIATPRFVFQATENQMCALRSSDADLDGDFYLPQSP